jgi:zinc transporter ZupT
MGSKRRTVIQRVTVALMTLTVAGCTVAWFAMRDGKPWLAFYVACCGGVMTVNLILVLLFVRRNVK